jgi:hypothetical protein
MNGKVVRIIHPQSRETLRSRDMIITNKTVLIMNTLLGGLYLTRTLGLVRKVLEVI